MQHEELGQFKNNEKLKSSLVAKRSLGILILELHEVGKQKDSVIIYFFQNLTNLLLSNQIDSQKFTTTDIQKISFYE